MEAASLFVRDIMSSPVITGDENETIKKIATKMRKHNIGSVVIVNDKNKPMGMITQGDIVRRIATFKNKSLYSSKVKEAMSRPVVTIESQTKIEEAARLMVGKKIKRLCVVNKDKKLVGIISDNDIMKNSSYLIDVLSEMVNTGYVKENSY